MTPDGKWTLPYWPCAALIGLTAAINGLTELVNPFSPPTPVAADARTSAMLSFTIMQPRGCLQQIPPGSLNLLLEVAREDRCRR